MGWWKLRAVTKFKRQETPSKVACLPYEILLAIIQLLDERSAACMLRTCRILRTLVEPFLYRYIQVDHGKEERRLNPLKAHLLHRTLVGRPDLLPVIRSYHGPLVPRLDPFKDVDYDPQRYKVLWRKMKTTTQYNLVKNVYGEYLEKAKIIFSGTINIQELHFTEVVSKDMAQVLGAFKAPRSNMMNIKRLGLNVGTFYASELVPILRTQPRLEHLELHGGTYNILLNETDLPELESLKAELVHAARIVPGRPIKKLELLDD
ncbi:hypothetical protein FRC00_005223, partial [Tulasnella sp. 408]